MVSDNSAQLVEWIGATAQPLTGAPGDYDHLMKLIGDARFVLLGEASHGTHEFYRERARITRRLITELGFNAVAVEADWPDASRVNRYVQGAGDDMTGRDALAAFQRFPTWMWPNVDVLEFVEWLRDHNITSATSQLKVGFYGIDLYSLHASLEAVVRYLDNVDPDAAQRARSRYACFDHFGHDPQLYGYAAGQGIAESCEDAVVEQLVELQQHGVEYTGSRTGIADDELFFAEQNARLAKNAEEYYRSMFRGRVSSWNIRDQHMAETLDALVAHLDRHGGRSKIVVWAHNSHLGDARATEMGEGGELNVGQLIRERYGRDAILVGFSTYAGSVTAASDWDRPPERKRVRPGLPGSYEALFHGVGIPQFLLCLRDGAGAARHLHERRLERAIGVVYRPETERQSHYFHARLAEQFDAILYFDTTRAVEPLDRRSAWASDEPADTFPFGV